MKAKWPVCIGAIAKRFNETFPSEGEQQIPVPGGARQVIFKGSLDER